MSSAGDVDMDVDVEVDVDGLDENHSFGWQGTQITRDFVAHAQQYFSKDVSKYQTKGATARTQNADSLIYFIIISSLRQCEFYLYLSFGLCIFGIYAFVAFRVDCTERNLLNMIYLQYEITP